MAGQIGYCGLDPRRQPLTGEEIRGCWEGWPAGASAATLTTPSTIGPALTPDDGRRPLEFVEVGMTSELDTEGEAARPTIGGIPAGNEPTWNLWGDADP